MRCSNSRRVGFCQFVVQVSGRSQTSGYRLWELSSKLFYMSRGYFPGWHLQVHFHLWPGPPVSKRSPLYPHISFQVTSESLGKWLSPKSGVWLAVVRKPFEMCQNTYSGLIVLSRSEFRPFVKSGLNLVWNQLIESGFQIIITSTDF